MAEIQEGAKKIAGKIIKKAAGGIARTQIKEVLDKALDDRAKQLGVPRDRVTGLGMRDVKPGPPDPAWDVLKAKLKARQEAQDASTPKQAPLFGPADEIVNVLEMAIRNYQEDLDRCEVAKGRIETKQIILKDELAKARSALKAAREMALVNKAERTATRPGPDAKPKAEEKPAAAPCPGHAEMVKPEAEGKPAPAVTHHYLRKRQTAKMDNPAFPPAARGMIKT